MIRSTLSLVLLVGLTAPAFAQTAPAARGPALLVHGNYCGPGNNAPAAPIDALDAACARHDACTPDGALASNACNLRLQTDAERVADDPNQPEDLRMMAGLVASGAAMMPSAPPRALAQLTAPAGTAVAQEPAVQQRVAPESAPPTVSVPADDDAGE